MTPKINETHLNDVSLTRTGDDSVDISWKIKNKKSEVAIYSGENPDAIAHRQPAATVKGSSNVSISGLDPDTRYYFDVVPSDGPNTIISERRVPLEGGVNFRDLGGYQAVDGRRVIWGKVFRSDNLGRLTDRDVIFLQKMGIRLVCDFRTPAEIKKLPDRYPPGPHGQSLLLPMRHGESDPANTFERIKNGDIDWMTEEFMIEGYIKNIENFAPLWATFFNLSRSTEITNLPNFHLLQKENVSIGKPAQIIRAENLAPFSPPPVNRLIASEIPEINTAFQLHPPLADDRIRPV